LGIDEGGGRDTGQHLQIACTINDDMRLDEITADQSGLFAFDDAWPEFVEACRNLPPQVDQSTALQATGVLPKLFATAVSAGQDEWRESPTRSIFHALGNLTPGHAPVPGTPVFPDLVWQTRFIMMAMKHGLLRGWEWEFVRDAKGNPLQVRNEKARTVRSDGLRQSNKIIRALYLYWFLNHRMPVKLPKFLYRGIRASTLYGHETFAAAVAAIWRSDKDRRMVRKDVIDALIKWICDRKLHQITDGRLLSFTSAVPIANYFANGEGFLLRVDPRKVEIMTSELHDENLATPDPMTGKREREFIVRIPENYAFTPADIIMHDLDYMIAEGNPLSVALFDHNDKGATYKMNGVPIDAYAYWKTNEKLQLLFKRTDNGMWHVSRTEFKQMQGFDPLPTPQNVHLVTDFEFKTRKPYGF